MTNKAWYQDTLDVLNAGLKDVFSFEMSQKVIEKKQLAGDKLVQRQHEDSYKNSKKINNSGQSMNWGLVLGGGALLVAVLAVVKGR